jgi:nucleoside-diphosphate-sugar epimerase
MSNHQMNVLIVGGAGYVGGALTDLLSHSEHHIRVFDALLYEESYRKPVDFVLGDVRDRESLRVQLNWADAVVWLAALVGDAACALDPAVSRSINQESVRWLSQNFDGRILFLSTCSVYGAQEGLLLESSATAPLSVYAETKLQAERYLADNNAIIFRLGTLFGIGDLFARIRLDLVVNVLTVKARRLGRVKVYGGDQYRPLLHVRDAARAIAESLTTGHRGVFNLARENVRIIDLAERVRNRLPETVIERVGTTYEDARNYRVSTEKAETLLGITPQLSVDQAIEEIMALADSGRLKDVDNPRYSNKGFLFLHQTHLEPGHERRGTEMEHGRRIAA